MSQRNAPRRRFHWERVLGLAAVLTGCSQAGPTASRAPEEGRAVIAVQSPRRVQFSAAQIKAFDLVLTGVGTSRVYSHTFAPSSVNETFPFSALDLPVGTYAATLYAYASVATSSASLIGSTATDSFAVSQGSTSLVTFPPLNLMATPTSVWPFSVTIDVQTSGYSLFKASASIQTTDGRWAESPTWNKPTKNFAWQNLPAFPVGTSTASITATAKKGSSQISTTTVATLSIVPGQNATTSVSITL